MTWHHRRNEIPSSENRAGLEMWNQQVSVGNWCGGAGERLKPSLGAPPRTTTLSLLLFLRFPLPSHPLSTALCNKPFCTSPQCLRANGAAKTFQIPPQNNAFHVFSLQMENASCQERGCVHFYFLACVSAIFVHYQSRCYWPNTSRTIQSEQRPYSLTLKQW